MCWPTSWRVVRAGSTGAGGLAPLPVPPVAAVAPAAPVSASRSTVAAASGRRATFTQSSNTSGSDSMRGSRVLPGQRGGDDRGRLEVHRVAGGRDDQRPRSRQPRHHALGELGVLGVALARDHDDRHTKLAESRPDRVVGARAQPAQRRRQAGRVVAQPILVGGRRHLGRLAPEDRLPRPAAGEGLDGQAAPELDRERLVGLPPGVPLQRVGDPRCRADQDEALEAGGVGEGDAQRQATSHGVSGEHEAVRRGRRDVGDAGVDGDRSRGAGRAVAAQVGRQRRIAFAERVDHGAPTRARLAEPVEEDGGRAHASIMTASDTHRLLRAFADELARCGMTDACTSPGSRSAPLVLALAREDRLRCHSHVDERCAGFFALGLAKASRRPVAVACTSGTAAAELTPAVHEAREARVPLIVLTADRPPELRETGAGQTIDQVKLYGAAAKWFFEVGVHDANAERMRFVRTLACRAYWTALEGRPGPVHLNVPLHEPLVPDGPGPDDAAGRPDGAPWVDRPPGDGRPSPAALHRLMDAFERRARGVLVCGRTERDPALAAAAEGFAETAGYPVLADPLSGARRTPTAVAHYDALLRAERFAAAHRPELVLRVGDLPTSKPLRAWLADAQDAVDLALDTERSWQDPDGATMLVVPADAATALAEATERLQRAPDAGWMDAWRRADDTAAKAIAGALGEALSEPWVAARLGRTLPANTTLFVASSMPVRDVETFFPARDDPARELSNRGANGIDGTGSSAYGAAASGALTVLLIGDVALVHDLGGLLAGPRLGLPLAIVLLNNDGGGIF